MKCPKCFSRLYCVDTRVRPDGISARRRLRCEKGCGCFTTIELFAADGDKRHSGASQLLEAKILELHLSLEQERAKVARLTEVLTQVSSIASSDEVPA